MRGGWRRAVQVVAFLLALEVGLAGLVFSRGFPYFGSSLITRASPWEWPVAMFHMPAIQSLSAMGLCCGFSHGLVLTHRVVGGHIPMRVSGTFVLAAANWLCWTAIALLAHLVWQVARSRRGLGPETGEGESA